MESNSSLSFKAVPVPTADITMLCDVSTGTPRPYIPPKFRHMIFNSLHSLSHPGVKATQHLITECFVWPNINRDVKQWTCSCLQCQCSKVHRHAVSPLSTFATPDAHFNQIHVDIVGPLPPSRGYTYLLTCVDRSHIGLKQCQFQMPQQRQLLEHLSAHGFLGLEFCQLSQWTEAVN